MPDRSPSTTTAVTESLSPSLLHPVRVELPILLSPGRLLNLSTAASHLSGPRLGQIRASVPHKHVIPSTTELVVIRAILGRL